MAVASAISRVLDKLHISKGTTGIDAALANNVAAAWGDAYQLQDALSQMDSGILPVRALPAVQMAMSSVMSGAFNGSERIMCSGINPYSWMQAAGASINDILCVHLGKSLPAKSVSHTIDDMVDFMSTPSAKAAPVVIALQIDTDADWNDVRVLSAAAVKNAVPMLVLAGVNVDAPKGTGLETISDFSRAIIEMRAALTDVRTGGAIRIVALADMDAASIERSIIDMAKISPSAWAEKLATADASAHQALNMAYQAPVTSF